ncbi:MAG: hypothetical protein V8R64_16440 [Thomasclavelia sp.]
MDKTSKIVLKYIYQLPDKKLRYANNDIDKAVKYLNINKNEFINCIKFLITKNHLKESRSGNGIKYIELSHIGFHFKEIKRIYFRNYLKNNFINIIALIVSIISLITSFFSIFL